MAEQAEGQPLDGRSDIFCLGVVLHEMISGRRAFEGDSTAALLLGGAARRADAAADARPRHHAALNAASRGVSGEDRRRRYQHAADAEHVTDAGQAGDDRGVMVGPKDAGHLTIKVGELAVEVEHRLGESHDKGGGGCLAGHVNGLPAGGFDGGVGKLGLRRGLRAASATPSAERHRAGGSLSGFEDR